MPGEGGAGGGERRGRSFVQLRTWNFGIAFISVASLIGVHWIGDGFRNLSGHDDQHKNSFSCCYLRLDGPVHNAVTMQRKISLRQMKHCFNVWCIRSVLLLFHLLLMPTGSPFSYLANSCYTGWEFQVINVCSAWKPRDRRAREVGKA